MVTRGIPLNLETGQVTLPRSAYVVYKIIEDKYRITPKDIISQSELTPRTVRFALTYLKKNGYVKRLPCLEDMRQSYYQLKDF